MAGHDTVRPRALPHPAPAPRAVRGSARLARGWAGALAMTALAALSHAAADPAGPHPGPGLVAVAAVLAAPVCTLLAGRALSLWRTGAAVGAAQGILHALFALAGPGGAVAAAPGVDPAHLAHGHAGALAGAGPMLTATAGHGTGPASAMLVAHLLAAVLTVALLRHGERVLLAAAERVLEAVPVLRLLVRLLVPTPAPRRRPGVPAGPPARRRHGVLVLGTAGRRGPPAFALAA